LLIHRLRSIVLLRRVLLLLNKTLLRNTLCRVLLLRVACKVRSSVRTARLTQRATKPAICFEHTAHLEEGSPT